MLLVHDRINALFSLIMCQLLSISPYQIWKLQIFISGKVNVLKENAHSLWAFCGIPTMGKWMTTWINHFKRHTTIARPIIYQLFICNYYSDVLFVSFKLTDVDFGSGWLFCKLFPIWLINLDKRLEFITILWMSRFECVVHCTVYML